MRHFISASRLTAGVFALVTTAESYLAIFPIATRAAIAGAAIVGIAFGLERRAITKAD